MKLVLFLLSFFVVNYMFTQNFDDYSPISSKGKIPEDILRKASEKASEGLEKVINEKDKKSVKDSKSDFILKSNFILDELLTGGAVLFGDPVTEYVNQVAGKLLESEPETRSKVRFYCVKSNLVNAFATHQGMIFVTLGLISQLETEAQLAFVLAHEITHFQRKHMINSILEADKMYSRENDNMRESFDDKIIKLSEFSKKLEMEADLEGLSMLEYAGYDLRAALEIFDVLQFANLPFDEVQFDFSLFEAKGYSIPADCILESVNSIDFEVIEENEKSSHPNLNKRREAVNAIVKENQGKRFQISSEEKFWEVRKIARFETVRMCLQQGEFAKAYYNSQILLKDNPDSKYLKNSIFKALYGIAMYKSSHAYSRFTDDTEDQQGEISQTFHFFEKISVESAVLYALKNGWDLRAEYTDVLLDKRLRNLINYSVQKESLNVSKASEYLINSLNKKKDTVEIVAKTKPLKEEELSKYDKIKKAKKKKVVKTDSYYHILNNVSNKKGLVKFMKDNKHIEEVEVESPKTSKAYRKNAKSVNSISLDKLIIVAPDYYKVDERKGVKLENSELAKYEFYEEIEKVSEIVEIETEILTPKLFREDNIYGYNDISLFNYWVEEYEQHFENKSDMKFIPSESDFVSHFKEVYDSPYFAYTGAINYRGSKQDGVIGGPLAASILYPFFLPYAVYNAVTPQDYFYYYTVVYDVEKNERVVNASYSLNYKARPSNYKSMMYDLFLQMKQSSK